MLGGRDAARKKKKSKHFKIPKHVLKAIMTPEGSDGAIHWYPPHPGDPGTSDARAESLGAEAVSPRAHIPLERAERR